MTLVDDLLKTIGEFFTASVYGYLMAVRAERRARR